MKTNKLMITCALCGGGTTRKQSPYVPLTPEELVADSLAAVRAGACILHIHVRDDEGANTMETSRFVQVVSMIGSPAHQPPGCHHQCHHLRHQVLRGYAGGPPAHPDARDVLL
ncbi:MAG: 3-keto-5-aminohexanoate cleavage protein [Flavonifractor plautii]